jgi:predicted MFS family arabinose efflux permease
MKESLKAYKEVIKSPGALRLLVAVVPPRIAYGMITLSIYFKVQQETGSIATAGFATGLSALTGALTTGLRGVAVDRFGIIWPLRIMVPLYAIAILSLSLSSERNLMIFLAALTGLFAPPINLSIRPLWKFTVVAQRLRTAYALDASSMRAVAIFAPVLATTLSLSVDPDVALQVCAFLMITGGVLLAPIHQVKTWQPEPKEVGELPIWRVRGFQILVLEAAVIGFGRGAFEIGIPATGTLAGVPHRVGTVLAIMAAMYVVGGLVAGAMSRKISALRAYRSNYVIWALVALPLAFTNMDWSIMIAVAIIGFFGGAAQVFYWEITEAIRPKGTAVQTIAWLWAIDGTSAALGITLGGYLSESYSPRYSLAIMSLSLFVGLLVITLGRRHLKAADRIVGPDDENTPPDPTKPL